MAIIWLEKRTHIYLQCHCSVETDWVYSKFYRKINDISKVKLHVFRFVCVNACILSLLRASFEWCVVHLSKIWITRVAIFFSFCEFLIIPYCYTFDWRKKKSKLGFMSIACFRRKRLFFLHYKKKIVIYFGKRHLKSDVFKHVWFYRGCSCTLYLLQSI